MSRRKQTENTDFLSDLVLLRNDPAMLARILPHAEQGNPHAQYALGLIYAEGRGVRQNNKLAYYWLSRAIEQGDQDAIVLRDVLLNSMSIEDVQQAKQMGSPQDAEQDISAS